MSRLDGLIGARCCTVQVPPSLGHSSRWKRTESHSLDTDDICKILEVTRTNIGVLLYRARNRLRECLETKGVKG